MLTQKLNQVLDGQLHDVLQRMVSTSVNEKVDKVASLKESYHKYKKEYVKHLGFDPNNENLSKWFWTLHTLSVSSHYVGACTTGGSLHLLWHGNLWWDWERWKGGIWFMTIMILCICDRNLKVTMEAQLGLIGGTMGLLTGFSILSAVEIIYYLFRYFRVA